MTNILNGNYEPCVTCFGYAHLLYVLDFTQALINILGLLFSLLLVQVNVHILKSHKKTTQHLIVLPILLPDITKEQRKQVKR